MEATRLLFFHSWRHQHSVISVNETEIETEIESKTEITLHQHHFSQTSFNNFTMGINKTTAELW